MLLISLLYQIEKLMIILICFGNLVSFNLKTTGLSHVDYVPAMSDWKNDD